MRVDDPVGDCGERRSVEPVECVVLFVIAVDEHQVRI
jgi:hypothetical protein